MGIDRRERGGPGLNDTLLSAMQSWQAGLWTAMPGIVNSALNVAKKTVEVQLTVRARVQAPDGSFSFQDLPLLLDCPVVFPSGGGFTLTFPVQPGDECLVVFASRCIDGWWQSGGVQNPPDLRKHDLSDGFVLVGASSVPNVPPNISAGSVQLRNAAGDAYIEINAAKRVRLVSVAGVDIVAPSLTHNGTNIGATHVHGGVQSGGSNTGTPT